MKKMMNERMMMNEGERGKGKREAAKQLLITSWNLAR